MEGGGTPSARHVMYTQGAGPAGPRDPGFKAWHSKALGDRACAAGRWPLRDSVLAERETPWAPQLNAGARGRQCPGHGSARLRDGVRATK